MDPELCEILARLARQEGVTESEVIRDGIRIKERMAKRERSMDLLIDAAHEIPGDIIKFGLK